MTKHSDELVQKRKVGMLWNPIAVKKEFKPKGLKVRKASIKEVRYYVSNYHYSKSTPDSTKECFIGYYEDGNIAGVVLFGMGTNHNQYTYLVPDINKGEYRELTRLWSPDGMPRNTESRLISLSLKMLPKKVKMVVSYADPSHNHLGIIYQATNWIYCGMSDSGQMMIDKDNKTIHSRLVGIYRMRHPDTLGNKTNKEIMNLYGWEYIVSAGKHRYVMFLGDKRQRRELRKNVLDKIKPYPKLRDKFKKKN